MQGSAEFFAPETRTVPNSGFPPRITYLSMKNEKLLVFKSKSKRSLGKGFTGHGTFESNRNGSELDAHQKTAAYSQCNCSVSFAWPLWENLS
jgi:hypothetical protein